MEGSRPAGEANVERRAPGPLPEVSERRAKIERDRAIASLIDRLGGLVDLAAELGRELLRQAREERAEERQAQAARQARMQRDFS